MCLCVCLFVGTLTAEPFDISSQNLVYGLTLMISRTSLMVKVIGQRSRSPGQKRDIQYFLVRVPGTKTLAYSVMLCDVMV